MPQEDLYKFIEAGNAIININTSKTYTIEEVKADFEYLKNFLSTSKGGQRDGDGIEGGASALARTLGMFTKEDKANLLNLIGTFKGGQRDVTRGHL